MALPSNDEINRVNNTAGTPGNNNLDASGEFPRREHFFSTNINFAATGGKRNELYIGGGADGVSLDLGTPTASEYPLNQVQETVSGHIIEMDDTPGNERVLIKHKDGAGVDLRADGTVIIASKNNKIEISGADHTVIVEGEGNLVYKGNLNLKVAGDFNIDVGGNYNLKTSGNKNENTKGSDRKTVNGSVGQIIRGGYSTTVTQQVTDTFLAGHSHNVKGTFSNNVDGPANYVSSGVASFTSEAQTNMSAPDVNIAGSSMSVFGDTGTIGGENIIMYTYNLFAGKTVRAGQTLSSPVGNITRLNGTSAHYTTFHGDLDGTAKGAEKAGTAAMGPAHSGSVTSSTATNAADDTTFTAKPTASLLNDYLSKAAGGVRKVAIDVGNYLKNFIDKSEAYGGIATFEQTTTSARARLKDPAHRSNPSFVSTLINEGAISPEVYTPTPPGSGRVVSGNSTPKFGNVVIGNTSGVPVTDPFLPIAGKVNILPDPRYNPLNQQSITSSTKLAPGVRLSKFLGGSGDPSNLDFIRGDSARKEVAKHLYYHATIVRSIMNNNGAFADLRLVVAEGVYKPGPNETITPDSINDLRTKGRAVVYELYNSNGELALTETFDLAEFWKDTIYFDKLILSYDTLNTDGKLHAQIIVTIPELDADWGAVFNREVSTEFNGNKMTQGDLVEALSADLAPAEIGNFDPGELQVGDGSVTYVSGFAGKIRNKPLQPQLYSIIEAASKATGIKAVIFSGGQDPKGAPNARRTGSVRHDNGWAADIWLYANGRQLSANNSRDAVLMQEYVRALVANGIKAVGIGSSYMGGVGVHVDISYGKNPGVPAATHWGNNHSSAGSIPWLPPIMSSVRL